MTMEYTSLRKSKHVAIERPIFLDRIINFLTDGVVMNTAAYCVTCIFSVFIGGILILKFFAPEIDANFITLVGGAVTGFAGFIVLNFNQRTMKQEQSEIKEKQEVISTRVHMIPCKKEIDQTAKSLAQATEKIAEKVADKQTEQIQRIVENSK